MMKTENQPAGGILWTNHLEQLPQEDSLPVMGTFQTASALQNINTTDTQSMNLIILPPNDLKLSLVENNYDAPNQNNYVVLKDSGAPSSSIKKLKCHDSKKNIQYDKIEKKKESYENMLYFVCNLCPFLCTKDTKIREHLENAHKNKTVIKLPRLKCPACANIFYHKMPLRSHLIHDHGVRNSDLSQIIQAVLYYSRKKKENKEKPAKQSNEANMVPQVERIPEGEVSNSADDYNSDASSHKTEKEEQKISLPKVDIAQSNSERLISSLMKQTYCVKLIERKINKCAYPGCKVRLQGIDKLNYHTECHKEDGFLCKDCGESFATWKPLTSHLWRVHKIDMDLYACDKCEYKSVSLAKLNNIHKLIHSEVRAFSCNICHKAFKNSKQLRNHKVTHQDRTKKILQTCGECTKQFIDKRQLRLHMDVVHKKLKPFLCNFCAYKGPSKSSLKMHIRQHTGEKPFLCDSCPYSTSDHNSLRRHKLRHTGQKPYKCLYCSYACIQSSTYKTHLKTKHPGMEKDLMFTCPECQFRSINKDMYTSHLLTIHKLKPRPDE